MTRKAEVEILIEKITEEKIKDQSFNFENCNAYYIALELNINRSNASRILNQLFSENRLIKIEGRPTLYISKEVIHKNLKVSRLPSILNKNQDIKNYFEASIPYSSTSRFKTEIVGIHSSESLYKAYIKIAPCFFSYPTTQPFIFFLIGKAGTGKKYMIKNMLQAAQKNNVYADDDKIFFSYQFDDLDAIDPKKNTILFFELYNSEITYLPHLYHIINRYENADTHMPVIFFSVETDSDIPKHFSFPYETAYFPDLSSRSAEERTKLTLYFILEEARNIKREIIISKNILFSLSLNPLMANNALLHHYINRTITHSLFHSSQNKQYPLIIENKDLPKEVADQSIDAALSRNIFSDNIQKSISLKPSMSLKDIDFLTDKKANSIFLSVPDNLKYDLDVCICRYTTSFNTYSFESRSCKYQYLYEKLKASYLAKDPQLINFVYKIIEDFITDRISLSKYKITELLDISSVTEKVFKMINTPLSTYMGHIPLVLSEIHLIKQLLERCVRVIQKTKIPVFIICHENNLSKNFAERFNIYSRSRSYYSIDYSDQDQHRELNQFKKKLYPILQSINRGHGIILLTDYYPLTIIDSSLVLNLKIPIFSFSPVSPLTLLNMNQKRDQQSASLSATFFKSMERTKPLLSDTSLRIKANRINNPMLTEMKELFPYLDTTKTNEALYTTLEMISQQLQTELTNQQIYNFIYHGNCILNNIHLSDRDYITTEHMDEENLNIFKQLLSQNPLFPDLSFSDEESLILYHSLNLK